MKRKVLLAFVFALIISKVIFVGATTVYETKGLGYNESFFVLSVMNGSFKTKIETTSNVTNSPVCVENMIQRKNSSGSWKNEKRYVIPMVENDSFTQSYSLTGRAETRSIWSNTTKNSFIYGKFSMFDS